MQGLASYGSDSDEEIVPIASTSTITTQIKLIDSSFSSTSASAPSLNRVKNTLTSSNSRSNSPLSGVRLPPSNTTSPSSSRTPTTSTITSTASPNQKGKQRASSLSPPPYTSTSHLVESNNSNGKVQIGGNNGDDQTVGNNVRELKINSSRGNTEPLPIGVRLDSLAEFGVPEMVLGPCNPLVEAKLANYHHLALTRNLHFNDSLSASKKFRNPRMYKTLVELVGVNETGSEWDKKFWDPNGLGVGATASKIAAAQSARSEAKASSQSAGSRSSIAFSSSNNSNINSSSYTSHSNSNPYSSSSSSSNQHNNGRDRGDEQARIREAMMRKPVDSKGGRDRERERDSRDGRGGGGGGNEKKSRWDTGATSSKRDRSRSPVRRR